MTATSNQARPVRRVSTHAASWLAWSNWVLSLALTALGLWLLALNRSHPGVHVFDYWLENTMGAVAFSTVGALIASRRPTNLVAWMFCALGLASATVQSTAEYGIYASIAEPGSLPGGQWAAWFSSVVLFCDVGLTLTFLFLLFPDGRLLSSRWRPLAWLAAGVLVFIIISVAFTPGPLQEPYGFATNPLGIGATGPFLRAATSVAFPTLYVTATCSLLSLVVRFRRSRGEQRQQIKWFAYAGAASLLMLFVLPRVLEYAFGNSAWVNALESVAVAGAFDVGIPAAVGVAVLRYRLYEIDTLINRTLVYGALTVMLVALYFGGIVVLQRVFVVLIGQQPTLAVVASTLLIAALFNPLRRRIQSFIDRRFYRRKYDARKTLEAFSAKLRDETDLQELTGDLLGVVRETMQPAHVSLWLRPDTASKDQQTDK